MISGIRGRACPRYSCAVPVKKNFPRILENLARHVPLTATQKTQLLALAALACCAGLCCTGVLGGQIAAVRTAGEQLEKGYLAVDDEHIRLLSIRADLSSRERIVKMAGTRFQLFEPSEGQVQHL